VKQIKITPILLKVVLLSLLFALVLGGGTTSAHAQDQNAGSLEIIFFWGEGCPHCAQAEPFLKDLQARYPYVKITAYEVWYDPDNQALYQKMADQYQVPEGGRGVPFIIIGDRYWMGYNEEIGQQIAAVVKEKGGTAAQAAPNDDKNTLNVPLIGTITLEHQSLFVSTLLISFVDGVNPCSVWVLTMLLALTLHTGSRKKVMLIGLIFLTVTAGVYALFIAGLFTVLSVVSFIGWIQGVVALLALFFGLVNIKDYFWYKEGLSFTIDDAKKPGIYQRMRAIMDASQSFWGLAGATVVMSAGVSLVEFSCTAGFPVLWTNMVAAQEVSVVTFLLLLVVYMVIYQLDEMVIFFTAVYTLKASKLEEKHGRILKLIGGILMFTLAGVMLVNPALMNSISSSLFIFGVALLATLLVLLVHRTILPRLGLKIGSEPDGGGRPSKASLHRH
jgi:glutaredoxin